MVVETPIPASSIRAATPEESEAWIDEWIKDIAIHFQEFAPNALAYAEAMCLMGYTTKSSLKLLHGTSSSVTSARSTPAIPVALRPF